MLPNVPLTTQGIEAGEKEPDKGNGGLPHHRDGYQSQPGASEDRHPMLQRGEFLWEQGEGAEVWQVTYAGGFVPEIAKRGDMCSASFENESEERRVAVIECRDSGSHAGTMPLLCYVVPCIGAKADGRDREKCRQRMTMMQNRIC